MKRMTPLEPQEPPRAEKNPLITDIAQMFAASIDPFEAGLGGGRTSLKDQRVRDLGSGKSGVPDAEVQYHVIDDRVGRAG